MLNDSAWLQWLGGLTIYLAMPLTVAVAALCDRSPEPAFPRWVGWANLWVALAIIPDQLLFFIVNFLPLRRAVLREREPLLLQPT